MRFLPSLVFGFAIASLGAMPARAELTLAVNEGVTYYVTPQEIREKYKDLADLIGKTLIKHMIASSAISLEDVRKARELMLGLEKSDARRKILEKIGYRDYESGDEEKLAVMTKWLGF